MTERQIKKELERQAVLFEEECASGLAAKPIKFEELMNSWFKECAELRLKSNTITGYHSMEPRIIKALGHIRMDKLTARDIQKFIVSLCECKRHDTQDKNNEKLSTKTIKLYKSFISTVCTYAVKMNIIKENPCKNVTIPKVVTPEKEFYSIEETQLLFDLFEKEDESNFIFVCFFTLAIYTGFRLGELLGLEWKDVNFSANVISVRRTCLYIAARVAAVPNPRSLTYPLSALSSTSLSIFSITHSRELSVREHSECLNCATFYYSGKTSFPRPCLRAVLVLLLTDTGLGPAANARRRLALHNTLHLYTDHCLFVRKNIHRLCSGYLCNTAFGFIM